MATVLIVVGAAAVTLPLEDGGGGSINSFGDALWWAVTTITTVGYGDIFPVTPAGRGVAAFLMLSGIALFGVLTANLATFLLEGAPGDEDDASAKLDEVLRRLAALEERQGPQ